MGARRVGVALTALALLALAWSPLGADASRALMEGDGARLPRRDGALGVAPSADGWEDEVPESSAGLASDVYWRRRCHAGVQRRWAARRRAAVPARAAGRRARRLRRGPSSGANSLSRA